MPEAKRRIEKLEKELGCGINVGFELEWDGQRYWAPYPDFQAFVYAAYRGDSTPLLPITK